jgi:Cellulose binding domain
MRYTVHRRTFAAISAATLATTGMITAGLVGQADAATPATTLVVNAATNQRAVTHVASGSLYGLATATTPADQYVTPLHPNTFVQMAAGGRQQPAGDINVVAAKAAQAGAKVVDRLADFYPGWPYQFTWNNWLSVVDQQVATVRPANLASYELWNEPDQTWLAANGTFNDFWVRTYREVRAHDATTPIQGPSFSDNISGMQSFLANAVATNTVPDIISWHELSNQSKITGDVATVTGIEQSLGISPRPISIEEYAAPSQVGIPGALVGYIAKFERLGIHDAELAFWNGYGALGDLLTGTGGQPNGAWWLYKWYGDMSGQMVQTVPPAQTGIDGAASYDSSKHLLSVIVGAGSGSAAVTVNGLSSLGGFGGTAHVKIEYTPSNGRTTAVAGTTTLSEQDYTVAGGSITVPIEGMNASYGYHLLVTPAGGTGSPSPSPSPSPSSTPTAPGGAGCSASYALAGSWPGGFQATVTVAAGGSAIRGWTVTWQFANGQTITQSWNATVTTSGSSVTATNVSYNGALAAGASTQFGFLGTWNGTNSAPALTCTAS